MRGWRAHNRQRISSCWVIAASEHRYLVVSISQKLVIENDYKLARQRALERDASI